jgi:hypothetical protein
MSVLSDTYSLELSYLFVIENSAYSVSLVSEANGW